MCSNVPGARVVWNGGRKVRSRCGAYGRVVDHELADREAHSSPLVVPSALIQTRPASSAELTTWS
jgi:hypothetical protein